MYDQALKNLASAAGIKDRWHDVAGAEHIVSIDSLRAILGAMGLPVETENDILDSEKTLLLEENCNPGKLITAELGAPIQLPLLSGPFKLKLASGKVQSGGFGETSILPGIFEIGYHVLEAGKDEIVLAVAPPKAYTLDEVSRGSRMWGLAVQLYALRRPQDGGFGDFASLTSFVRAAAFHGADAVAISPVHAQFSANTKKFSPYAPSNRAAFNILHIAENGIFPTTEHLVDWPAAGFAKIQALREVFKTFDDDDALDQFLLNAGSDLERHAVFEAIQEKFLADSGLVLDWRDWPIGLQSPDHPEVLQFKVDHAAEIRFHIYLQYRADRELAAAQRAARIAGMKIGLIADLAVGTDQGGSHSWSRQNEILRGLEVGAPPDAINRNGQSWGITAFSPRGLRHSGFSAFTAMLRHALKHAGGLRIDHVMGLARLWLIPHGMPSSQGAYLHMPMNDLMRLVRLESHLHKAIILGEDLGTLPDGFQATLDDAGISGLRVLWFEKTDARFNPPALWSKTAVAVTSTHDLPTVAGWWKGKDVLWREKLNMPGDGMEVRQAERVELWNTFIEAGVTSAEMPAPDDGSIVADAACAFLGKTASTLAILPIEDALGLIQQPNLPGTTDEHPNWRRRLVDNADDVLNHPDVTARLAKLNELRKVQ